MMILFKLGIFLVSSRGKMHLFFLEKRNETNNNLAAEDASWEIFHERGSIRKENAKRSS